MDSPLDWISEQELAALAGAHPLTARRWKRDARKGRLPAWLRRLVDTCHRGMLDEVHDAWAGWIINTRDGELVSPEGVCVTMGQIRALPYLYAQIRALRELQRREAIKTNSTTASNGQMGLRAVM